MSAAHFDVVIKVGGALLADPASFGTLVAALDRVHRDTIARPRHLIVPGGGPFADTVRAVDSRLGAGEEAAHWMAILGMDQCAHLLVARIAAAEVVETVEGAMAAWGRGRLPVLAPFRWLRACDPLPHTWAVTSDSIAAWVALAVGASELVLVKPVVAPVHQVTDPYFATALAAATGASTRPLVRVSDARLREVQALARS